MVIVYFSFPPSSSIKSLNFSYMHFRLEYSLMSTPASALSLELHFLQPPSYQHIKSHFERLLLLFHFVQYSVVDGNIVYHLLLSTGQNGKEAKVVQNGTLFVGMKAAAKSGVLKIGQMPVLTLNYMQV